MDKKQVFWHIVALTGVGLAFYGMFAILPSFAILITGIGMAVFACFKLN